MEFISYIRLQTSHTTAHADCKHLTKCPILFNEG